MDEYQISAFIDDQLQLNEKIDFVEAVHADKSFKEETIHLLRQEICLREPVSEKTPSWRAPAKVRVWPRMRFQNLGWFGGGLLAAVLLAVIFLRTASVAPTAMDLHRFVIYDPDIGKAAIAGSFSNWRELEMQRAGESGYWEIVLKIENGEHRYSFILDGRQRVADPTRDAREQDDFGGFNSILTIRSNTSA